MAKKSAVSYSIGTKGDECCQENKVKVILNSMTDGYNETERKWWIVNPKQVKLNRW